MVRKRSQAPLPWHLLVRKWIQIKHRIKFVIPHRLIRHGRRILRGRLSPRILRGRLSPRILLGRLGPRIRRGRLSPRIRHGSRNGHRPGGHLSGLQVLEASRVPTPPPLSMLYGAGRAYWKGGGNVRLCLPFPCVSTPLYGPSCFLSLVHSSPSVFDLLLTWCCFPWLLCVHKPWVFPESLSVNSSMWLCILCSVIKLPLFLLPLVSRVLPAARLWHLSSLGLHLFDQKYSRNSNMTYHYNLFHFYIFKKIIYSCDAKRIFQLPLLQSLCSKI